MTNKWLEPNMKIWNYFERPQRKPSAKFGCSTELEFLLKKDSKVISRTGRITVKVIVWSFLIFLFLSN